MFGQRTERFAGTKVGLRRAAATGVVAVGLMLVAAPAFAAASTVKGELPVHVNGGAQIFGHGEAHDSGSLTRVCVTLWRGGHVPLYGWMWEQKASNCVDTPGSPSVFFSTPAADCYPGIYYSQVQGFEGDNVVEEHNSELLSTACDEL
jgi:hypothetical protein